MGRKVKDLSGYKTIFVNEPSQVALDNWFRLVLQIACEKYGTENVVAVLRKMQEESDTEEVRIHI